MNVEQLAAELIGFNTEIPPGNEEKCARYIRDYVDDLGLDGCICDLHAFQPGRANLIVKVGPEQPGLLLSGHIDVVPAGNLEKWTTPPFEARTRDGRLFGRGAADMKTGVAALLKALESVKGKELKRRLVFVATAGEEVGYDGLSMVTTDGKVTQKDAKYAIVAEPTEMKVVRGHRGGITLKVTFEGRSAHASRPEFGINAVENCSRFISELNPLRKELGGEKHPELGSTIVTPTVVHGGTKSNVVPETCELTLDARTTPLHDIGEVEAGVRSIVSNLRRSDKGFRAKIEPLYLSHHLLVPKRHEYVRLLEKISGSESTIAPYGTEAPFYQRLGMASLVFGPGSVKQAHIANEYVSLKDAREAVDIYTQLVHSVCL